MGEGEEKRDDFLPLGEEEFAMAEKRSEKGEGHVNNYKLVMIKY